MKNFKFQIVALAFITFIVSAAQAAYSQEGVAAPAAIPATATEEQKQMIQPSKCNGIIQDISATKDEESLRNLIEDAFTESCPYENYEKFVADAKIALEDPAFNNKDYLSYAMARARLDQLSALSKNNDIEAGRLYMSVNDAYFNEALLCLDKVAEITKSKSLAIDNNILKFVVFKEKFQPEKSDFIFDAIAAQLAGYSEDKAANKKELESVSRKLKNMSMPKYAIKMKILYVSKVDPETAKEVLEEIKMSADRYFAQNDMKEAADLYEQYMLSAPAHYDDEAMGAKIMEVAEKYFASGKYKDAKKYYGLYMEKYPDLKPADYCSYKLALSCYYMKDNIRTISQLESFLEKYKNSAWFDKAFETLAKVYYENLPRDKAIDSIQSLMDRYYRQDAGDYAQILMAMLYYRAKNYETAEDKLNKITPTSSCYYTARMIMDDIKEIKHNKSAPMFGTDATESYKVWEPYQGLDVKIAPFARGKALSVTASDDGSMQIEVNKGDKVHLALQGMVDEDKFNEYTIDKEDQSRLPKMIKEETEKDLLSLHWSVEGGNFADDKETDVKEWQAPNDPGIYKMTVKVDDFGLVRVPNKGVRKDTNKDAVLNIVVK